MFIVDDVSKSLNGPRFTFMEFERSVADIIERAGGQDATAQRPWTIRKDADFSGSADYPWMVVSNAPHGPCDANVLCSRMSEENARMVVKALTSACGETAWVSELLAATKMMCESLPLYSPSSAAFMRKERLDAAIKAAEKFCAGGSLKSAIGVKADLEHPGNDTGGESAESLLPSPPTAEEK